MQVAGGHNVLGLVAEESESAQEEAEGVASVCDIQQKRYCGGREGSHLGRWGCQWERA